MKVDKNRGVLFIALIGVGLAIWLVGLTIRSSKGNPDAPPLIGIPSTGSPKYADAIRKAGGEPVSLPYDLESIETHIKNLDGILFPGGDDIDPAVYGEEIHPTVKLVSQERYTFESKLMRAWLDKTEKPFLGVCLGCQMLNVVQGGSLIQDIPSQVGSDYHRERHSIEVEADSRLLEIMRNNHVEVNSSHHQAVNQLGEGLRVTARSPDGVIEAIEGIEKERFILGLQWHPERMTDPKQLQIFVKFIEAARAVRKTGKNLPKGSGYSEEEPSF